MDDRTYRRMTQETAWQRRRRYAGLPTTTRAERRCGRCEGTGRRLNEHRLPTDDPCASCRGTGRTWYTRTR